MYSPNCRTRWLDGAITAFAPAIWGSTYIVASQLLPPDRPFTAAALRALPAGLALVLICRRCPAAGQWGRMVVLAALNIGLFQAFLFLAAYRLPGGVAAVVGAIQPLLVMALAWAVDRLLPARLAAAGAVIGVVGMALLLLSPVKAWDTIGVAAALTGAVCMAGGTFLSRRWRSDLPVLAFTGWQLLVGGAMIAPVAWLADPPLPALTATQMAAYVYLSAAGALLAYTLWFRGITRLPPEAVSSLGLLSPVSAVVLGWVLLGQAMSGQSLMGMIMVLAGILAVQWAAKPKVARPD